MTGPAVVVMGAPGAGKSTIGPLLAEALGLDFIDVDDVISAREGRAVAEIFAVEGETAFRVLEEQTTAELLKLPVVLSLGGGAVLSEVTRAALRGHRVIWLQVSAGAAVQRIGITQARPLLLGNVRSQLIQLLAARLPLYAECATETVDTDGRDPEHVLASILHGARV